MFQENLFRSGLKRLSNRISDARTAVDVLRDGAVEYQESLRQAINSTDSSDDINLVHPQAVLTMFAKRKDLRERALRMNDYDLIFREDPFKVNNILAVVDRGRERVAGLRDIVFGDPKS